MSDDFDHLHVYGKLRGIPEKKKRRGKPWPLRLYVGRVPRKLKKRSAKAYGSWRWLLCRPTLGQTPLWYVSH